MLSECPCSNLTYKMQQESKVGIKIPVSSPKSNLIPKYDSSENLFDPSTTPPDEKFLKRLNKRMNAYSKFENLSKLTSV